MKIIRDIIVFTNNISVCDRFNKAMHIHFIDGGYIDVLYAARDEIHKGKKLISHPLMGSIKPNETPYRSIIIDNRVEELNMDSLLIIENSIERYRSFTNNKPSPCWSEKALKDFRFVDLKLIESALYSLNINC